MGFPTNQRKIQVLKLLDHAGWLNPPAISTRIGFFPTRAMYSYLLRLHRWGLLDRRHDSRGLLLYRLSARGRSRLAWLQQKGGGISGIIL
jgi:DNA-binding IclR family transcriptional regulator